MTHQLKIWPEFFERVVDDTKPFEIRKGDRLFNVGDTLLLREWLPVRMEYTGRTCERRITYTLTGMGLQPGYVALGLAKD